MGAGIQPVRPPTLPLDSSPARNAWRRKGAPPESSASQAAGSMPVMLVEIFVRIERSHASRAGGSNGLTIHMIRDIASGKYPGNAGGRRRPIAAGLDDDVTIAHVQLPGEYSRVRGVPDGYEGAGDVECLDGAAMLAGPDVHTVHPGLIANDLVHGVVPGDAHLAGLFEREQPVL